MLRRTFLYLSQQSWLRHWMENSPVSRKLTSRFIAGQTLPEGIRVLQKLATEKVMASLDFLGENVSSLEDATRSKESYLKALCEIEKARLPATISVKLTQLGLDFSEAACFANVAALVERASGMGTRVEIDMESSDYTERTLAMLLKLQELYRGSVRAVIQAYLHRSEGDINLLCEREIPVRLCKGAYRESPAIAFQRKAEVDANYVKLLKLLLDRGTYPAIASHDEKIVREGIEFLSERKISGERFEFQMLYGIRRDLQRQLINAGYRLRLYVPYGDAWYPYFMRRLAERPANVFFLAKNLVRS
jgi:proline dehydrogenase